MGSTWRPSHGNALCDGVGNARLRASGGSRFTGIRLVVRARPITKLCRTKNENARRLPGVELRASGKGDYSEHSALRSTMKKSTRRLRERPSLVSFGAMGRVSP